jgi:hypothetical protein
LGEEDVGKLFWSPTLTDSLEESEEAGMLMAAEALLPTAFKIPVFLPALESQGLS